MVNMKTRKETKMFTAYDANTNTDIPVKPIVICESRAHALLIADANTDKGIRLSADTPYCGLAWVIDHENYDLSQTAEYVGDVYGDNEKEWAKRANEKLAFYGLKLGRFDEKAGDRWELVEV